MILSQSSMRIYFAILLFHGEPLMMANHFDTNAIQRANLKNSNQIEMIINHISK